MNMIIFRIFYLSLIFLNVTDLQATYPSLEPDTTLVQQKFNFLENFDLNGKKVVIFGCGHGNQNERGCPGDHGNHQHLGVTCLDISHGSNADYILDVTKDHIPEKLTETADIVYFEYLTPEIIYHPMTMANALKCLKKEGMLMWDIYWQTRTKGDEDASACLSFYTNLVANFEIGFLNKDPKYQSIFQLQAEEGLLSRYFSFCNNPFNGRMQSKIFHIPKADLNLDKVNAFIQFFRPEALPGHLINLKQTLSVHAVQEIDAQKLKDIMAILKNYANSSQWHPEMAEGPNERYSFFGIRLARGLEPRVNDVIKSIESTEPQSSAALNNANVFLDRLLEDYNIVFTPKKNQSNEKIDLA